MNARPIAYWATTSILAFLLLSGGFGELTHQWGTIETVQILGYPLYFLTIIGACKVAGALALIVPRFPRLKEWAYAGVVFNMTGAAASHAFSNDYGVYAFHLIAPLLIAALGLASWALLPLTASSGSGERTRSGSGEHYVSGSEEPAHGNVSGSGEHYGAGSGEPAAPRRQSLLRSFLAARSFPRRPPAYVLPPSRPD
jgi:uncharacterized membrane protein YphA (DoxX/SURF4 family)